MPRALVCLDEVPATDGTCTLQAWQEIPTALPTLSVEDAHAIGMSLLACVAGLVALKLINKAA